MAAGTTFTIKLNADASEALLKLSQFATQVSGLFANLVPILSGFASIGSALHLGQEYLELAGQLGRLSEETGLTVEQMAGLAYAANQAHIPVETLARGMKTFSEHLVKTGQGSKDLKEALLEEAKAFEQLPNGAAKATRAIELFGRSGLAMIPLLNKGPAELQAMFERGELLTGIDKATVLTASEFSHALKDSKLAAESLAGSLLIMVLPALTKMLHSMTDGIVALRQWVRQSEAFKVSIEAAGVALAAFSAYKLSGPALGLALLPLSNFFGPIKSISDFVTALQLLPAALMSALGPIAAVAVSIASLTAVVVAGIEAWKMFKSFAFEKETAENVTRQNIAWAESIRKVIAARKENGQIPAAEAEQLNRRIDAAMINPDIADKVLGPMSRRLTSGNSAPEKAKLWTEEELKVANQALEAQRESQKLDQQKRDLAIHIPGDKTTQIGTDYLERRISLEQALGELAKSRLDRESIYFGKLNDLNSEADKLLEERSNVQDALAQKAITEQQAKAMLLKIDKDIYAVNKSRQDLGEAERHERISEIDSDFTLTGAEKFKKKAAIATADERKRMGADPESFTQNFAKSLNDFRTQLGTLAQQTAHLFTNVIGTAIQGVSQGITGLIHGTVTWSQALANVGDMILNVVIQALVNMFAAWVTGRNSVSAAELAAQAVELPGKIMDALATAISSYGVAAVIGIAALVAGLGVGMAAAMGAFADGGRPPVGEISLVGERGPELFVPDRAGTIIPNHHMDRFLTSQQRRSGSGGGGAGGKDAPDIHIGVLSDRDQIPPWIRRTEGRQYVLDIVKQDFHTI